MLDIYAMTKEYKNAHHISTLNPDLNLLQKLKIRNLQIKTIGKKETRNTEYDTGDLTETAGSRKILSEPEIRN